MKKLVSEIVYNYCPHCGKKLPKRNSYKANFCCYCGYKLRNESKKVSNKVQCTICHGYISHKDQNIIKCSFCGSQYHSSCVSSWLQQYNACPLCQNVYIFPDRKIIELNQ